MCSKTDEEDPSFGQKIINFLCGFGKKNQVEPSAEEAAAQRQQEELTPEELAKQAAEFLDEPTFWKK